ncbi:MAG TPA: hypothetical protein DD761_19055 [Cyanobacteria bacterium UBA11691]|nr:hypothetical protein [Cyanobacteria bacterium UBA11691]
MGQPFSLKVRFFSAVTLGGQTPKTYVPPENKTPAYTLVNIGLGGDIRLRNQKLRVSMQVQNLFNKAYLNHTSYYRLMSIPEQGRNIVLNVAIPFTTHLKSN